MKNSHEYFGHKYNVSNNINENLNLLAKNFNLLSESKNFFIKNLKKNIYLYDKNHIITLNILNFVINKKIKIQEFSETLNRILKAQNHRFPFDGKYLMDNGMQQGSLIGKVLKVIEQEWIKNNFKISKKRVGEIIRLYSH